MMTDWKINETDPTQFKAHPPCPECDGTGWADKQERPRDLGDRIVGSLLTPLPEALCSRCRGLGRVTGEGDG